MSWKIDNIDLADYGIIVSKVSGLFDSPKILNEPTDWLDETGLDFWHDDADQKFADKKITLTCSMSATTYNDFIQQLQSFYDVVYSPGLRQLKTPYTDIECYLDSGVSMDRLDRHSRYVESKQVGIFILNLIMPGDPDFLQLEIKRWTGNETLLAAVVLTKDLKVSKTLQGDIYATCTFESNIKLNLKYFDYIQVNSNGVHNDNFHLPGAPEFRKLSTNKYIYNLRLEHQSKWLNNSSFLNDRNEADFYFHANMEEIVDLIIDSHNRSWWNNFAKGTIVSTERRNHKFNGESCMSVLKRLCKEYELEFEFEYIQAGNYYINVKEKVANDKNLTLKYGKGKGLYELSREQASTDELCTVLYAYGAAKNLKPDYRNGISRLSFEGNPLKNNEGLHDGFGPHEKAVFFDDIFPQRRGTVTAYEQKLPTDQTMTEREKYLYPDGIFKMEDNKLDFDINDYLLRGLTAKVRMETGDLAGYQFEVNRYDHDLKIIFLIPFKDERGKVIPDSVLTIKPDDEYILIDIGQPVEYVADAENRLAAAAVEYIAEFSQPKLPYRAIIDPAFMEEHPGGFEVGDRITIEDSDYDIDGAFRISNLIYDKYKKTYELTLSDEARLSRSQRLEMRVAAVERSVQDTGLDKVEQMRKDKETTNELRTRLLDPLDDKLKVDNIIRNESIDPRMLSWDAGIPQWFLKGALVETDVGGDYNKVNIGAGIISVANDPRKTLERYEIQKIKDDDGDYDPTRSWVIAETTITLNSDAAHFVYAKIDISDNSTDCEIVITPDRIEPKAAIEDSYIFYEMGTIPEAEEL